MLATIAPVLVAGRWHNANNTSPTAFSLAEAALFSTLLLTDGETLEIRPARVGDPTGRRVAYGVASGRYRILPIVVVAGRSEAA